MAPILDGSILPDDPLALAERGQAAPVPVMAGVVADESRFRGGLLEYRTMFAGRYGAEAEAFLRAYPAANDADARAMATMASRERLMAGLRQLAGARREATYLYMFAHVEPGGAADVGAFHSSEIPYVFGTLEAAPERPFTDEDRRVSRVMMAAWTNFVKTGDPNGGPVPAWPDARAQNAPIMELGGRWAPLPDIPTERRDFMRAYLSAGGRAFLF
jgi:para-nitrobenzyl esterase